MAYITEISKRVTYAETDRMGYLYYGNYPEYYEIGRTESMRGLGFTYREMEDSGILMPVLDMKVRYIKPAYYDEVLLVRTTIEKLPEVRMEFLYEIFNAGGEKINEATTTLVFVSAGNSRPVRAPGWFLDLLKAKWT